ncbi:hypothetical protein HGA88_04100 [Candidatus Roizmanbacteria bacterium]|nr:hypothetical protein [Candidatus Roizmanbacteria bacterium]
MKGSETFFKIYSNLPFDLREEIVLVIHKEPITWKIAYIEISQKTKLGEEILQKLQALQII